MLRTLRLFRGTRQPTDPPADLAPPEQPVHNSITTEPKKKVAKASSLNAAPTEQAKTPMTDNHSSAAAVADDSSPSTEPAKILIAGGGIIGLIFALALEKHTGIKPELYEQAHGFEPDVGAGMGLYANGLRVIRDIDPDLLQAIVKAGYPYLYRRWERHDGTSVAVAEENVLTVVTKEDDGGDGEKTIALGEEKEAVSDDGLQTIGIRRWKLQQILHQALQKAHIPVHFNKKVRTVRTPHNGMTEVVFTDGSQRQTELLVGADGGKSVVRSTMIQKLYEEGGGGGGDSNKEQQMPNLDYTGVTCIMGVAENINVSRRGISFPIAPTTRCHGCFYPTSETEQCFQFHFPLPVEKKKKRHDDTDNGNTKSTSPPLPQQQDSCWGNLSQQVGQEECRKLAEILQQDGWDEEKFLKPLRNVTHAVRVGFVKLSPSLDKWSFHNAHGLPRTVLVGDAAHPPVPYIVSSRYTAPIQYPVCLEEEEELSISSASSSRLV
jgi:2-polyprenyl-6-methoxyphenol hydroxylase-like FAD-dependent oxidoreductase